ncbi:MAG: RodZ domain-containing protein [Nitrospirota bacterium]
MARILRERRLELGKDINEIAEVTRIKGAYLRSIEEEEYDKLPVEVYTRGYIKEYADFLGIPPSEALDPYERYLEERGKRKEKDTLHEKSLAYKLAKENSDKLEPLPVLEEVSTRKQPAEETEAFEKGKRSLKILWIIPLLIAAAGVYFYHTLQLGAPPAQAPMPQLPPVEQAPPAPPPAPEGAGQQGAETAPPPQASSGTATQPAAPAEKETKPAPQKESAGAPAEEKAAAVKEKSAAPKKKHSLDIVATDKTWIQMVIDSDETKEVLLNPGDKVGFAANESFALTIGNAAGIKLKYDGKAIEHLGEEGEVVRITLPASAAAKPSAKKKSPASAKSESPEASSPQ